MRCVDVNVLVYAHRADSPEHVPYRALLETWANDDEPLGLADAVLAGFLRVVTNRRVFVEPTAPELAWQLVGQLVAAPAAVVLHPGERHWEHFERLARSVAARGNDVPDAFLAAFAIENNATFVSADRGFARFRELRWVHPLDGDA
jgi:toxin-antitoxin system PIN domain toxin